jgi:endo-1,4-beta-xylanase
MKKLTILAVTAGAAAALHAGHAVFAGPEQPLKALAAFPVGVAVPAGPHPNSLLTSRERQELVKRHFDSLTAENIMKMASLQPHPGEFVFEHADALADYAGQHALLLHGHVLVWHKQAPDWMDEFEGTRDEWITLFREHIRTVAGHFAGRVASWDVVNEAFTDEVPTEYRDTIWYEHIGPEYIEMAFRLARDADPRADLYYIDYGISGAFGPGKLERVLAMVDDFRARDIPIDGIGFQMHIHADIPRLEDIRASFAKAADHGIKVRISELDVSMNTGAQYAELTPGLAEQQRRRYTQVVRVYKQTVPPHLRGGITVWGITDADSWIPEFRQRPDWPLLFDANFKPKPAFDGMVEGLSTED